MQGLELLSWGSLASTSAKQLVAENTVTLQYTMQNMIVEQNQTLKDVIWHSYAQCSIWMFTRDINKASILKAKDTNFVPVSYTHLTLPTIYSV